MVVTLTTKPIKMQDPKEIYVIFNQFAKTVNDIATEKGFWKEKENRNRGEMRMLIISELAEALEAHRKGKFCTLTQENNQLKYVNDILDATDTGKEYESHFELFVKDTVQDEMADVVIRVLDYMHGWDKIADYIPKDTGKLSNNFGEGLENIVASVLSSGRAEEGTWSNWPRTLYSIIRFCVNWKIDILTHVRWKSNYNQTRPYLHGKNY